jgi:uncharacterized protein (TIGR02271 family)
MDQAERVVVVSSDGLRGTITQTMRAVAGESDRVLVRWDDGRQVVVARDELVLQADGSYTLALSSANFTDGDDETVVVPVVREELQVGKRVVERGGVRLRKIVHVREEVVDEPLVRERVDVQHVPVDEVVALDAERATVRREGETLIIPVLEEVLVVERRLLIKEELHVTLRRESTRAPQTVTLRSEEVVVEPIDAETTDPTMQDAV